MPNKESLWLVAPILLALAVAVPWLISLSVSPDLAQRAQFFSNIATVVALAAASAGVILGFRQYSFDARARRTAHMHSLFGDFLRMRFDLILKGDELPSGLIKVAGEEVDVDEVMLSFRLYTLEELHEWVRLESRHRGGAFASTDEMASQDHYLEGWRNTIKVHLRSVEKSLPSYFKKHADCYGSAFLGFVVQEFASCKAQINPVLTARERQFGGSVRRRKK